MIEQVKDAGGDVVLRDTFAQYGRYAAVANGVGEVTVPAMMAFHAGMWPSDDERGEGLRSRGGGRRAGDQLA